MSADLARIRNWNREQQAQRIAELEQQRDELQQQLAGMTDTAKHFSVGMEYYRGLIDDAAKSIGIAMYTTDEQGVHPEPLRAKLPECVSELVQQRDELQARWDGIQHLIKANGAGSVAQLAAQRDELIAASDEAVSEMKATAWDEEGYLLDPDLDDAANSLRATIAKVKP